MSFKVFLLLDFAFKTQNKQQYLHAEVNINKILGGDIIVKVFGAIFLDKTG